MKSSRINTRTAAIAVLLLLSLTRAVAAAPTPPELESGQWGWPAARILIMDIDVNGALAREWLPAGVQISDPALATVFIADYPTTQCCGEYREVGVMLHVNHPNGTRHCPWMLVDNDVAMIQGRDFLGFPKKMGEITLDIDPNTRQVEARVDRLGHNLIRVVGQMGGPTATELSVFDHPIVNVWGAFPQLEGFGFSARPKLLFLDRSAEERLRAVQMDVEITIQGSISDPLDEIQFGDVVDAQLVLVNVSDGNELPPMAGAEVGWPWIARTLALRYE